jgi:hypothetical protein
VPSRRQPARATRQSGIGAAVVVIVAGLVVGYLALKSPHQLRHWRPTACMAGLGSQGYQLSVGQAGIAATIAGVATRHDLPTRAVAIAYATALQESKLANLHYGTMDSVGVFQQRPSEGWGTARQIENPVYATSRFFAALVAVPRYQHMQIDQAAQAVQRSADGSAYEQYAGVGTSLARAFTGTQPHAVWCSYGSPVGHARLAAARHGLTGAFGALSGTVTSDPAAVVRVENAGEGWAVAAWLVSHAAVYGISDVRYAGYEWRANTGSGQWKALKLPRRARPATAVVAFG